MSLQLQYRRATGLPHGRAQRHQLVHVEPADHVPLHGSRSRRHRLMARVGRATPALAASVVLLAGAEGALAAGRSPNFNYALHCQGCRTYQGLSSERSRIPALKDVVGHFTRIAQGRRYLVNVPGIVNSGLSAEETAAILNWVVEIYGGASRPS